MSAVPFSLWRLDAMPQTTPRVIPSGGYGVAVRPDVRDALIAEIAPKFGIRPTEIMGKSRTKPIAHARQEVMWRLRNIKGQDDRPKHSYPLIARCLGLGNHTTVIFGVRAHAKRLEAMSE